jgi:histidinol-phosphate/aromatic aminotransferase/cobyric acid decarboxylase-like protein
MSQSINIDYVRRVLPAYEITSFTALVLSEILDSLDEVKAYTNETRENLNILRQGLLELGIPTSSSKANFLAVKLGEKRFHDELKKSLGEKNVLIRRPFREKNLQNWVRISTAPPKIQELLLRELREILS